MPAPRYPTRHNTGRSPRFEMALAVLVLALVLATAAVFLFVYHDFPLRVS